MKRLYKLLPILTVLVIALTVQAGIISNTGTGTGHIAMNAQNANLGGEWSLSKYDTTTGTTDLHSGTFVTSAAPYDTLDGLSSDGFHAIHSTTGNQVAASPDDIPYIAGNQYVATFTAVLTSGQAPIASARIQPTGGPVGDVDHTVTAGENIYAFTAVLTTTGNVRFLNSANAEYTISNFVIYNENGTILDRSAFRNNGTHSPGNPTWTFDRFGNPESALSVNGTTDHVEMTTSPVLGTGDFSMAVWMDGGAGANEFAGYVLGTGGTNNQAANIGCNGGNISAGLYGTPQSPGVSSVGWHHVALVYTEADTTTKIYVDGEFKVSNNTKTANITGGASLGKFLSGVAYYYGGDLDEAKAWNKALTPAEVLAAYEAGSAKILANSDLANLGGWWSLGEYSLAGTGTILDNSAYLNNGTSANTPTFTTDRTGQPNKAMSFNGTSDYVDLSSSDFISDFGSDTKGSISLWVKANQTTGDAFFSISKGSDATSYSQFLVNGGKWNFVIASPAGAALINLQADNNFNTGEWYYVVVTQDGITSKIYVNGMLQADTDSGEWFSDMTGLAYARIGNLYVNGGDTNYFDGSIDDVRYYSEEVLTQSEITALYNQYNGY